MESLLSNIYKYLQFVVQTQTAMAAVKRDMQNLHAATVPLTIWRHQKENAESLVSVHVCS